MKFLQEWYGKCLDTCNKSDWFKANVPGNIQNDFAVANNYGDINYGVNFKMYEWMEDVSWVYKSTLQYSAKESERVYFVSDGIDYIFDILLNGGNIYHQEGMFTRVELDLTDKLKAVNVLEVIIYPHPKRQDAFRDRMEADQCCKPAVSYGWDWHQRVIPSGIWNDTYIETRADDYIYNCETFYKISDDYKSAEIKFDISCNAVPEIELYSEENLLLYKGTDTVFHIDNINLWWCNGQGKPYLYRWRISTENDEKTGFLGLRNIELVMNEGSWNLPDIFPKTRSTPPITIMLNGREIFAKGSNWVNPEIFTGTITYDKYYSLIELARKANMNIFRCWGGAGINKNAFYEICNKLGIMVWQEFPLACNNYRGTESYLKVLEQEAVSIVKNLRRQACVVLWCGGNELFNSWSRMTDQSLALRLLNKICYEHDIKTPFIMTSPLMGIAHGGYVFYDNETGMDVFQMFNNSKNTAYTEFGVPGTPDAEYLKQFIPEEELFPVNYNGSWQGHHALNAFGKHRWLCLDVLEKYFGNMNSLEDITKYSQWLQCEGYKAIFEEARRQKPYCSMAINWCYNEPWKTAANNSIISYPDSPKNSYYAVAGSLRPVLASARIDKFDWIGGEMLSAELWLLNDSVEDVSDTVKAYIEIGGAEIFIMEWNTGLIKANTNMRGHKLQFALPNKNTDRFTLKLISENGYDSEYVLLYRSAVYETFSRQMNL